MIRTDSAPPALNHPHHSGTARLTRPGLRRSALALPEHGGEALRECWIALIQLQLCHQVTQRLSVSNGPDCIDQNALSITVSTNEVLPQRTLIYRSMEGAAQVAPPALSCQYPPDLL